MEFLLWKRIFKLSGLCGPLSYYSDFNNSTNDVNSDVGGVLLVFGVNLATIMDLRTFKQLGR